VALVPVVSACLFLLSTCIMAWLSYGEEMNPDEEEDKIVTASSPDNSGRNLRAVRERMRVTRSNLASRQTLPFYDQQANEEWPAKFGAGPSSNYADSPESPRRHCWQTVATSSSPAPPTTAKPGFLRYYLTFRWCSRQLGEAARERRRRRLRRADFRSRLPSRQRSLEAVAAANNGQCSGFVAAHERVLAQVTERLPPIAEDEEDYSTGGGYSREEAVVAV